MVDHKTIEMGEDWIKVDKKCADRIQAQLDLIIATARMIDLEAKYQSTNNVDFSHFTVYVDFVGTDKKHYINMMFRISDYYLNKVELYCAKHNELVWERNENEWEHLLNLLDKAYDTLKVYGVEEAV